MSAHATPSIFSSQANAGGLAAEPLDDALRPRVELLERERVVEREHRRAVRDRREQLVGRRADPLRGESAVISSGKRVLEVAQLAHQLVVLGVADLRLVEHVVAVRVVVDLLAELLDADLRLGAARARRSRLIRAISTPPATPIRSPITTTPPRTPGTRWR